MLLLMAVENKYYLHLCTARKYLKILAVLALKTPGLAVLGAVRLIIKGSHL